jgi:hypothetical protein
VVKPELHRLNLTFFVFEGGSDERARMCRTNSLREL